MQENIRPLEKRFILQVVDIHMTSLPEDFLPSLGIRFLKDVFYPGFLASQYGSGFVFIDENDDCIGFAANAVNSGKLLFRIFLYNPGLFIFSIIRAMLTSKRQFMFTMNLLFSVFHSDPSSSEVPEIYVIAVRKDFQGKGIGRALVNASMDYFRETGKSGIKIKTLSTNVKWIQYFQKNNWIKVSQNQIYDREYVVLEKDF